MSLFIRQSQVPDTYHEEASSYSEFPISPKVWPTTQGQGQGQDAILLESVANPLIQSQLRHSLGILHFPELAEWALYKAWAIQLLRCNTQGWHTLRGSPPASTRRIVTLPPPFTPEILPKKTHWSWEECTGWFHEPHIRQPWTRTQVLSLLLAAEWHRPGSRASVLSSTKQTDKNSTSRSELWHKVTCPRSCS